MLLNYTILYCDIILYYIILYCIVLYCDIILYYIILLQNIYVYCIYIYVYIYIYIVAVKRMDAVQNFVVGCRLQWPSGLCSRWAECATDNSANTIR